MTVTIDFSKLSWVGPALAVVLAAVGLWLAAVRFRRWLASRRFSGRDLSAMRRRWEEIESLSQKSGEMGRKMAVMEADKLLDHALKSLAMPGQTLGERLRFAGYKWPKLRQVWWAHKVRNQLVHEASYHLDAAIARRAIRSYRSALKLIGIL